MHSATADANLRFAGKDCAIGEGSGHQRDVASQCDASGTGVAHAVGRKVLVTAVSLELSVPLCEETRSRGGSRALQEIKFPRYDLLAFYIRIFILSKNFPSFPLLPLFTCSLVNRSPNESPQRPEDGNDQNGHDHHADGQNSAYPDIIGEAISARTVNYRAGRLQRRGERGRGRNRNRYGESARVDL